MAASNPDKAPSRLQRLADIAGLIFRAMGSEMGQPSEEVIREEQREKRRRYGGPRTKDRDSRNEEEDSG
jgi:hypothetical protein